MWGFRGSLASAGPDTVRYGGNTACVQVDGTDGPALVLDAGTGMRRAGLALADAQRPIHILLTHLHMDHIQGLGFFRPLFQPGREIHVWGPQSTTQDLRMRLTKYLSPPLFPVRIRDLASRLELHDVTGESWPIGPFRITSAGIIHPGPTGKGRAELDEPGPQFGRVEAVDRALGPQRPDEPGRDHPVPLDRPGRGALGGLGGEEQFDSPSEDQASLRIRCP